MMTDLKAHALAAEILYPARHKIVAFLHAEGDPAHRRFISAEQRIIAVDDGQIVRLHGSKYLHLRAQHAQPVVQKFQMRVTDHGDDRDVRAHHVRQPRHFAEIADAHFHHGCLRALRHAQQRARHAQLVVEVLFGLMYA